MPFRGQFVRAVLVHAGQDWTEAEGEAIPKLMGGPPGEMLVPFMGPPVLVDHQAGVALAQMQAIVLYLGETLGPLPTDPAGRAMAMKVAKEANDVLDDLTLDGGRQMRRRQRPYRPRRHASGSGGVHVHAFGTAMPR